ncbi:methylmalonyl-CoA epimerase [bacterium]|nr:methylmalonyl-CoA epimerase [bacterium]
MPNEKHISFSGIDHIGIAVNNLEKAIDIWQDILSIPLSGIEEVPSQNVRVAVFKVGDSRIELVEATSPDSPIAKFIANRGEGIHHIALRTKECATTLQTLHAKGVPLIDKTARPGAGKSHIGFVHPKSLSGVLLEITER